MSITSSARSWFLSASAMAGDSWLGQVAIRVAPGDARLPCVLMVACALLGGRSAVHRQCVVDKLVASNGAEQHKFGRSLAILGRRAVAGATGVDENRGAAYVLELRGSRWIETARLEASDGRPGGQAMG